jgi:hypothetical protein
MNLVPGGQAIGAGLTFIKDVAIDKKPIHEALLDTASKHVPLLGAALNTIQTGKFDFSTLANGIQGIPKDLTDGIAKFGPSLETFMNEGPVEAFKTVAKGPLASFVPDWVPVDALAKAAESGKLEPVAAEFLGQIANGDFGPQAQELLKVAAQVSSTSGGQAQNITASAIAGNLMTMLGSGAVNTLTGGPNLLGHIN